MTDMRLHVMQTVFTLHLDPYVAAHDSIQRATVSLDVFWFEIIVWLTQQQNQSERNMKIRSEDRL